MNSRWTAADTRRAAGHLMHDSARKDWLKQLPAAGWQQVAVTAAFVLLGAAMVLWGLVVC